jgi:hypothetical protein
VKRGWWRATCLVLIVSTLSTSAFAQSEPSVEPLAPPGPPPPPYVSPYAPAPYRPYSRAPARLRYEEGDPIPPGYHVVHRSRQGLVIGGSIMFLVSYGISLSVAFIYDFKDETNWLTIPVAGPWLMMYHRSQPDCDSQSGNGCVEQGLEAILRFYLGADGVVQAAGAAMFLFGIAGRKILVRDDVYANVHLMPTRVGASGYGAMLTGRF